MKVSRRQVNRMKARTRSSALRSRVRILGSHARWTMVARGSRFAPFFMYYGGESLYVDRLTGRCGTWFSLAMPVVVASFQREFRRFSQQLDQMSFQIRAQVRAMFLPTEEGLVER